MVPAARWFAILFYGRVGSTYLCKLMNTSSQVVNFGELFNPGGIAYTITGEALATMLRVTRAYGWEKLNDLRGSEPVAFFEVFRSLALDAFPDAKWLGFKSAFPQDEGVNEYLLADRNVKKILLRRRNELAVYSSFLHARKTKLFHATKNRADVGYGINHLEAVEGKNAEIRCKFDGLCFEQFRVTYNSTYENAARVLNESAQSWLEFEYVDVVSGRVNSAIELELGLLGPLRNERVELLKIGSSNPIDRFENPEDVIQHLREIGEPTWAEPELK